MARPMSITRILAPLWQPACRAAFFLTLVFALYMALAPAPIATPTLDSYGDKAEHMLAFATLTTLARLGWTRAPNWLVLERLSFIGALIEVFQAIPSLHRDCDWHDWVADTLAIMATLGVIKLLRLSGVLDMANRPRLRPVTRGNA